MTMFTRKHYEAIAGALRRARLLDAGWSEYDVGVRVGAGAVIAELIALFEADSETFNAERFRQGAGE